jgi:hypothetical protein
VNLCDTTASKTRAGLVASGKRPLGRNRVVLGIATHLQCFRRVSKKGTLIAVVEAGNLSAASRRLGIPLATISRRLSDLERRLISALPAYAAAVAANRAPTRSTAG